MNRRELGRGRLIASLGALLVLAAVWLPWWRVGGTPGLPESTYDGLSGAGILVFLGAVFLLALVVLPYAAGDRPQPLDRAESFVVVAGLAVVGLAVTLLQVVQAGGLEVIGLPDRVPGLWLGAAGVALMVWGTAEIVQESPRR
jgi:hypothetical protein